MQNSLELVATLRVGVAGDRGAQPGERHFMELVVDGEPLGRLLGPFLSYPGEMDDHVSVLVTDWPVGTSEADVDRLLGADPDPSLDGRVALYVCPECGDLGCGGVTAAVEVADEEVVWRDLGYQHSRAPFDREAVFHGLGPFTFSRGPYTELLEGFRCRLRGPSTSA